MKPVTRTLRVRIALGALLAALVVVVAVRSRGPRPTAAPRDAGPAMPDGFVGQCRFEPGEVRAFRVSHRATQGDAGVLDLRATLTLRAEAVDAAGEARLTGVFTDIETRDEALQGAAAGPVPFVLRLARDCRFEAVGFAPTAAPATARALRSALRTYEVVVPTGAPVRRWSVTQAEDGAELRVRYAVEARDGGVALTRRRERITPRERVPGFDPAIVRSEATWSPAPDARWLDALRGAERLRLSRRASPDLDLVSEYSLLRVPGTWPEITLPPGWPAVARFEEPASAVDPARLGVGDPALALDLAGATAHLGRLYDARTNPSAPEAVTFLVSWLEAHPDSAARVIDEVRAGRYPERLAPVTFFAMSQVRAPAVRDALGRAVEDADLAAPQRIRAAVALGDSVAADPSSVASLERVARAYRPGMRAQDESVTDSALNAVGTLASRATGETAEAAHGVLRASLDGARDPEARADALNAAGNSHDARYRPDAERSLDDRDGHVRASAARALGAMRDAAAEPTLRERLATETEPVVLMRLIEAIRAVARRPEAETVRVAVARLATVDDPALRVALVDLIGSASDVNPAAREALRAWFARERDGRVLAAIGRYLPAEALGAS